MREARFFSQCFKCFLSIGNCSGVTPDDCRTQYILVFVNAYQSMHLVRDADSFDICCIYARFCQYSLCCLFQIFPPVFRILFRPTWFYSNNLRFCFRKECRRYTFTAFCVYQTRFYGRAADVIS